MGGWMGGQSNWLPGHCGMVQRLGVRPGSTRCWTAGRIMREEQDPRGGISGSASVVECTSTRQGGACDQRVGWRVSLGVVVVAERWFAFRLGGQVGCLWGSLRMNGLGATLQAQWSGAGRGKTHLGRELRVRSCILGQYLALPAGRLPPEGSLLCDLLGLFWEPSIPYPQRAPSAQEDWPSKRGHRC